MGLQGVATAVPVPGGLPAPFGFGFEAGRHPGEVHLVTEEPAPDPAPFDLAPAKVAVGMDAGPAEPLVLAAAASGAHIGGGVAGLFCEAPWSTNSSRSPAASGTSASVFATSELRRRELPVVEGLGQTGVLGGPGPPPPGALWPRRRGARDLPNHSAADPWPSLVYSPVSSTRGA